MLGGTGRGDVDSWTQVKTAWPWRFWRSVFSQYLLWLWIFPNSTLNNWKCI